MGSDMIAGKEAGGPVIEPCDRAIWRTANALPVCVRYSRCREVKSTLFNSRLVMYSN